MKNLKVGVLLRLVVLTLAGCSLAKPQLFKSDVGKFSVMTPRDPATGWSRILMSPSLEM